MRSSFHSRIALYAKCQDVDEYCVQRDLKDIKYVLFDSIEFYLRNKNLCESIIRSGSDAYELMSFMMSLVCAIFISWYCNAMCCSYNEFIITMLFVAIGISCCVMAFFINLYDVSLAIKHCNIYLYEEEQGK